MESRITLITLGVAELPRAVAFYRDGLGLKWLSISTEEIAFFDCGGVLLSLYPRHALAEDATVEDIPTGFSGITLAHNVREREQVAQVLAEAEAAGGTIVKPAQDVFWGGHSGYFRDPDGHLWEVAWNPHLGVDEQGRVVVQE